MMMGRGVTELNTRAKLWAEPNTAQQRTSLMLSRRGAELTRWTKLNKQGVSQEMARWAKLNRITVSQETVCARRIKQTVNQETGEIELNHAQLNTNVSQETVRA